MGEGLTREMFLKDTEANLTYWPLFYQNSKIRSKASSVSLHDRAQGNESRNFPIFYYPTMTKTIVQNVHGTNGQQGP